MQHLIKIAPVTKLEYQPEGPVLVWTKLASASRVRVQKACSALGSIVGPCAARATIEIARAIKSHLLVGIGVVWEPGNDGFKADNIGVARREECKSFDFQMELPEHDMHGFAFHRGGAGLLYGLHVLDCDEHLVLPASK